MIKIKKKSKIATLICKTTLQRNLAVAEVDFSFNRSLISWFPVSAPSIRILTNGVNSPGDNNQVSILYGMEMTKTILCLTIFVFGI